MYIDPSLTLKEENSGKLRIKTNWEKIPLSSEAEFRKWNKIENFLIEHADIVTGNSNRITEKVKEIHGVNCYYLPDGVDIEYFNPEGRFEKSYDKDSLEITFVGSYQTRKQPGLIKYLAESFPHNNSSVLGRDPIEKHYNNALSNCQISKFFLKFPHIKSKIYI